jgi:hypothetical protein
MAVRGKAINFARRAPSRRYVRRPEDPQSSRRSSRTNLESRISDVFYRLVFLVHIRLGGPTLHVIVNSTASRLSQPPSSFKRASGTPSSFHYDARVPDRIQMRMKL